MPDVPADAPVCLLVCPTAQPRHRKGDSLGAARPTPVTQRDGSSPLASVPTEGLTETARDTVGPSALSPHSAFIYRQEKYGTHVYATNNGTGAMHIIDITDPYHPKEAGRFRFPGPMAGNSLHDIDVQDGMAYLSNWNNGLLIIDIGNGMKGGSPSNPLIFLR